jgi:hypothetical protein
MEDGKLITFGEEDNYTINEAVKLLNNLFADYEYNIEFAKCTETNLDLDGMKYDFNCNFLLLKAKNIKK